jgi:FMN phosphatase YigB (HAD superfamily)
MDEATLGKRLQLARKRAGLTQQELCQKAGLSYSTLAKIERGAIKSPSVFTVAAISMATGTSLEDLLEIETTPAEPANAKKRSKSGITFVYFDVHGTIARFVERAFTKIAKQSGKPIETVETLFWRYDHQACEGKITPAEANKIFAAELGMPGFDWQKYYLESAEITPGANELLKWVSENYDVGLLTNNWLGFTDELIKHKGLPAADYKVIVESAKYGNAKPDVKIYQIAQEMAGVKADEILLVDDNQAYLAAADRAGWHAMWFDGFQPEASADRVKSALEF